MITMANGPDNDDIPISEFFTPEIILYSVKKYIMLVLMT